MRSAVLAALLLSAAALAARESSSAKATDEREPEPEDESDSAPFMIVVEHSHGARCGGSLVSLRTALTSAWCVLGAGAGAPLGPTDAPPGPAGAPPGPAAALWALAPGAQAMRRVARLALAAAAPAPAPDAWAGAATDLAVLELEAPFGGGARPILMATQASECAPGATCHVVRALGRTPRLLIVDGTLEAGEACAERAAGWLGVRDSALCLVGPTLCSSDWGAGVVCEGKLCGVLSRSAGEPAEAGDAPEGGAAGATCGDTHVAQSVARWRRFLHCAHTLRACGRGGDCAQLCSERRLLDTDTTNGTAHVDFVETTSTETVETSTETQSQPDSGSSTQRAAHMQANAGLVSQRAAGGPSPTRTVSAPRPAQSSPLTAPPSSPRASFEFEPNRPDFKGGPARSSSVYLKAGEYGDNGAEYGGEEPLQPTSPSPPSSAPPTPAAAPPQPASPSPRGAKPGKTPRGTKPTSPTPRGAKPGAPHRTRASHAAPRFVSRLNTILANLVFVLLAITNLTI